MTSPLVLLFTIGVAVATITDLRSISDLPAPVRGEGFSGFVSGDGGEEPYTFSVTTGSLPDGLTLDASTGEITGTPTTQGYVEFGITVTDNLGATYETLYTTNVGGGLSFGSLVVPDGEDGVPYSVQLTASGGTPPYTFSVVSGSPPWSSMTSAGLATGTPSNPGMAAVMHRVTVRVTDSVGNRAEHVYSPYVWPDIESNGSTFTEGLLGLPYSGVAHKNQGIYAPGLGTPPAVSWAVTSGSIPPGLTLNTLTGEITGTPITSGNYSFTLTVSDVIGGSDSQSFAIYVHTVSDIDVIFQGSFGNNTDSRFPIQHDLDIALPKLVIVYEQIADTSGGNVYKPVDVEWEVVDNNNLLVRTATIPISDQYTILISG